jgi:preprotein translocase subunit SecE
VTVDVNAMEIKKNQELSKPANASAKEKEAIAKAGQWQNFLGDLKDEFSKISWTSPEELKTYTKIVVAGTFFFGMGIYVMDLIIRNVLNGFEGLVRLIGG